MHQASSGKQWLSPAPTTPPALYFQAFSPETWQAAHTNIHWQHFQQMRLRTKPFRQEREIAGERESWEKRVCVCVIERDRTEKGHREGESVKKGTGVA